MSISFDGVRLVHRKGKGPWGSFLGAAIMAAEIVLTIFLTVAIGAHIFFPSRSIGATGSPQLLSYEGLLTDASGNPLGGTGTQYCFRFSVYDAASAGTKLWPGGTPATSTATSTDGVFSALIGQADALTYNFYDNDTTYLNVDVYTVAAAGGTCTGGSWQTLSPRQQITSAGYSISAENVYGSLLQTQTANSRVQVGLGSGSPTPIFLGLDVKSTSDYIGQSCTTSGTVWYNSAISKALVCENGVIQAISNAGATTTIAAINANAGTPATTGTIVFSNANGVTFGINGNTITASVNAGGGAVQSGFIPYNGSRVLGQALASSWVIPFSVGNSLDAGQVVIPVHYSQATNSTLTASLSIWIQIFTRNGATLNNLASASYSISVNGSGTAGGSVSNSYSGLRHVTIALNTTLNPGNYFFGFLSRTSSAGANASISNMQLSGPNNSFSGFFGSASTVTQGFYGLGYGTFSVSRSTTTASFNISEVRNSAALLRSQPFFFFTNSYT